MQRDILSIPPVPAVERVHYGNDPSQFYDVFGSQGTPPSVVMIHGGFWRSAFDLTHASHLCSALAQTGLQVASLEYRRVGETGGGWPITFEDVIAGVKSAAKQFPPVVIGHSAGGHLALLLASGKLPLKGVVALAPVACLQRAREENLGSGAVAAFLRDGSYADADPAKHASLVPRVLIHGTDDDDVPLSQRRCYVEARGQDSAPLRWIEVEGAGHFDLIDPASHAWPVVLANVKQLT
jgi:acetyl esterase/lipase